MQVEHRHVKRADEQLGAEPREHKEVGSSAVNQPPAAEPKHTFPAVAKSTYLDKTRPVGFTLARLGAQKKN